MSDNFNLENHYREYEYCSEDGSIRKRNANHFPLQNRKPPSYKRAKRNYGELFRVLFYAFLVTVFIAFLLYLFKSSFTDFDMYNLFKL